MTFTKKQVPLTIATYELPYADIVKCMPSYMVDGLIILSYTEKENIRKKHLEVHKLRGTKHFTGKHLTDISKNGIILMHVSPQSVYRFLYYLRAKTKLASINFLLIPGPKLHEEKVTKMLCQLCDALLTINEERNLIELTFANASRKAI